MLEKQKNYERRNKLWPNSSYHCCCIFPILQTPAGKIGGPLRVIILSEDTHYTEETKRTQHRRSQMTFRTHNKTSGSTTGFFEQPARRPDDLPSRSMGLWGGRGLLEDVRELLVPPREWWGDCPLMALSDSKPSPIVIGVMRRESRREPPAEWRCWLLHMRDVWLGPLTAAVMFWKLGLSEGGALTLSNLSLKEHTFTSYFSRLFENTTKDEHHVKNMQY